MSDGRSASAGRHAFGYSALTEASRLNDNVCEHPVTCGSRIDGAIRIE